MLLSGCLSCKNRPAQTRAIEAIKEMNLVKEKTSFNLISKMLYNTFKLHTCRLMKDTFRSLAYWDDRMRYKMEICVSAYINSTYSIIPFFSTLFAFSSLGKMLEGQSCTHAIRNLFSTLRVGNNKRNNISMSIREAAISRDFANRCCQFTLIF